MIYRSEQAEQEAVLMTAARMCAAARTAPKTHGVDKIRTMVVTGEEKEALAAKMEEIGAREAGTDVEAWFRRDAANVRGAQAVVLLGVSKMPRGVASCDFCGFPDCAACKGAGATCGFVYVDLGVAAGSAVSTAAQDKVDSRIMFSVGKAAQEMDFVPKGIWLGIPVCASGKNIFFDREVTRG